MIKIILTLLGKIKGIAEIRKSEAQIRELVKTSCLLSKVPVENWLKLCRRIEYYRIIAVIKQKRVQPLANQKPQPDTYPDPDNPYKGYCPDEPDKPQVKHDLQPNCTHCWSWSEPNDYEICSLCGETRPMPKGGFTLEQPTPTMPLIPFCSSEHTIGGISWETCNKIKQQRDADMAWHQAKCKNCIGSTITSIEPLEAHDSTIRREFAKQILPILEDSFLALFAAKSILWDSRAVYYLNTTDDYRKHTLNMVIETLAKYPEIKKLIDRVMAEKEGRHD